MNLVWPAIKQMNEVVPTHSRVMKELVIFEDPQHPFLLTDKGTVREKLTLDLYAEQIERAYQNIEKASIEDVQLPTVLNRKDIMTFLQHVVRKLLPEAKLNNDSDLFRCGTCDPYRPILNPFYSTKS